MSEPIPLFSMKPVNWDVTDPWLFTDPYGAPCTADLSDRKWRLECDHDGECSLEDSTPCGTPIGYRLVQEFLGSQ